MKKYFTLLLLALLGFAYSQELSVNDHGVDPTYGLGDNEVRFALRVRNHDSVDHRIRAQIEPELATGHNFQFCWDICYALGHTYSIDGLRIAAGDSLGAFTLYFRPNNSRGVSRFKVTFFAEDNPDIRVTHTMVVNRFGVTSILPEQKTTIKPPSPNPATDHTELHINIAPIHQNISLRIYNLLGKEIKRISIKTGTTNMRLDLRKFRQGIYFLYLHEDDKPITSQKLVVLK
ncbi:MAG: T9SS type A sorting domain-containing protein [Bacteroidia bacterium]